MKQFYLAGCALLSLAGGLFAGDLMPLQPGNLWVYREATTGHEITVSVQTPVMTNDLVYYTLSGYTDQRVLARLNERGDLVYLNEETGEDFPLTSFVPFEHGWWQASLRACDQEGQTLEKRSEHDGPAGPFRNVQEIRYRSFSCADAGVESEQYVENIGMVRRVSSSIAGPRVYNLVYARVGRATIDAMPHGRFSVSVAGAPSADHWTATMRLGTTDSPSLPLRFPTAQEYELLLMDQDGNVVWRWSDGMFFAEGGHSRDFGAFWSLSVEIPNTGLAGATYELQAWLTTEGPSRYAATVPLAVSLGAR